MKTEKLTPEKLKPGIFIRFKDSKEIYLVDTEDPEENSFYLKSIIHYSQSWRFDYDYILKNAELVKPNFIMLYILKLRAKKG